MLYLVITEANLYVWCCILLLLRLAGMFGGVSGLLLRTSWHVWCCILFITEANLYVWCCILFITEVNLYLWCFILLLLRLASMSHGISCLLLRLVCMSGAVSISYLFTKTNWHVWLCCINKTTPFLAGFMLV